MNKINRNNEIEWLESKHPEPMLKYFTIEKFRGRKLRLFVCGCLRQVWDLVDEKTP